MHCLLEGLRDAPGGLVQLVWGVCGVSQYEPWNPRPLPVPGQRVNEHPGPQDRLAQVRVAGLSSQPGERDEQVQPGRDALDAALRYVSSQLRHRVLLFPKLPPGADAALCHFR